MKTLMVILALNLALTNIITLKAVDSVFVVEGSDKPSFASVIGSVAVFERQAAGSSDLWSLDLVSGIETRLTDTVAFESMPICSALGVIHSTRMVADGPTDLVITGFDGTTRMISEFPGDDGRFWVSGNLVVWVNELDGRFSLWCHNLKSGKRTLVRAESFENLTHVVSNGTKIFWSQQNDAKDLDVWMFDPETGKTEGICVEPGDQYCVSAEGNYVAIFGHYVFRPDRDLFVYDIGEGVEIPVDSSQEDVTYAAISNGHIAYLLEPLSKTIDCRLMVARLGSAEIEPEAVSRVPLTEKERLLFSWPLAVWGDKRDCYDKGIDLWAYDFNEERQFPVSFDPGDQYALGISSSVVAFMTSRQGKFSLTFKTLSR